MKPRDAFIPYHHLLLSAILALALFARMRYLLAIEHNIDQAYPIWQALTTLTYGTLPTIGQGTSVLFANPPMTGYLYLPMLILTRSPLGVEILVIGLNTVAVWMGYRIAQVALGDRWALVVALLLAVNPWLIEYSRTTWVQSLLPFFATALLWQLVPVLIGQTRHPARRIVITAMLFSIVANTYLLAFLWGVPLVVLLIVFRRRVNWRAVMLGGVCFMVMTAPYILTLMSNFEDVQTQIAEFGQGGSRLHPEAWGHAVRLVTGADYALARGVDAPIADALVRHTLSSIAHYALLLGIVVGIGQAVWRVYRRASDADMALIALVWFFIPIIAMSYTSNPVHPFYQLLGVPMGAIFAVWGIKTLSRHIPQAYPHVFAVVMLSLAMGFSTLMLVNSGRFAEETLATPGAHDLGALPIGIGLRVGQIIHDTLPDRGIVFADTPAWVMNSFAGRIFPLIRDTRAPNFTVYPAHGAIYMTMGADMPRAIRHTQSLFLADETHISLHYLPLAQEALVLAHIRTDVPTQEGLRWVGYRLWSDEEVWTIRLVWQVDFIAPHIPELILGAFVHVYTASGERVVNVNGEALEGWRWQVGDVYVDEIHFSLPQDGAPFTLHIGQYDGVRGVNLQFDFPDDALPASQEMLIPVSIDNIAPLP